MSLFSRKAYDKLIAMTGKKKGGVPMLVGELWPIFQLNIKANPPCFQCARAQTRANDAINYAQ